MAIVAGIEELAKILIMPGDRNMAAAVAADTTIPEPKYEYVVRIRSLTRGDQTLKK